ncbi:DNA-processing protein DprA [Puniceibacterium sp. IMCC21224]|uniref:DNA-processing protein DprA n=1 Tax=Puniceibacterium sp. IMCC21224 TaxID=1618204 RepID=UPI00064DEC30|nr:DNA-processing protein DprA [Puniceibacterium sp. IMCC21224]KMK68328.1 DNA protecting protein DprA [Puniceibacterium sp. IMCC21224]
MTEDTHSSNHPLLPPTSEDERFDWLRLLRSRRVGVSTFYRLLCDHGSARAALTALPQVAAAAGVTDYAICPEGVVRGEMRAARNARARMICRGEPDYPVGLNEIAQPPPILWVMGDIACLTRPMVALVGARNASSLGTRMARALASGLGEAGITVVSGLARGVDTAAHVATLSTGTVAVMGGGVDLIYPAENTRLGEDIVACGGVRLSEQPVGLQPQARHFPARNRIISGLAQAVVVVEAAAKSGSLITARYALDQGREVLAVPGHPFDARASGCNMLIRDGAHLVRGAEDVLELLSLRVAGPVQPQLALGDVPDSRPERRLLRDTAALHSQILARLGPSPLAEDQLIRDVGGSSRDVSPVLIDLELEGRIRRQPGGMISLAG